MTTDDTALDSQDTSDLTVLVHENEADEQLAALSSAPSAEESLAAPSAEPPPSIPAELRVPLLQALLVSFGDPLAIDQLMETSQLTSDEVRTTLAELRELLSDPTSGIELVEVGARFQIRTKVAFSPYIRTLKAERPRRLSGPALETLAIVAYQQPVPKSDIDKLRGVDSTPTLKTLLERGLVRVVGQSASVGHPSLYGTTDDFLKIFGLSALTDLPSLREASSLERDPGEPDEGSANDDTGIGSSEEMGDEENEEQESASEEAASLAPPRGLANRITIERISDEEAAAASECESSWFTTDSEGTVPNQVDHKHPDDAPSLHEGPASDPAEDDV